MRLNYTIFLLVMSFSSYSQRNLNSSMYIKRNVVLNEKTGIFLTYGQSNSVNSGELGYVVKNNVYQSLFGQTYVYRDPSLGVNGNKGSVWGMVGDKLIDNGIYDNVVFSNCGYGGKRISDLNSEPIISFLVNNYKSLINKFGKVDGILFHQGEADNNLSGTKKYYIEFVKFLEILMNNGIEIPIYLSRVSSCEPGTKTNYELINIQNKLINDFEIIKKGPNTDLLVGKKYRHYGCHFSLEGFNIFSDMWIHYIIKEIEK